MAEYPNIHIESWQQFREEVAGPDFKSWAFRGHSNAGWPLFSTLSRYFRDFHVLEENWPQQESRILRIFRRKAHLFLDHIPEEEDDFQ